jgi:hypothetical protein
MALPNPAALSGARSVISVHALAPSHLATTVLNNFRFPLAGRAVTNEQHLKDKNPTRRWQSPSAIPCTGAIPVKAQLI